MSISTQSNLIRLAIYFTGAVVVALIFGPEEVIVYVAGWLTAILAETVADRRRGNSDAGMS